MTKKNVIPVVGGIFHRCEKPSSPGQNPQPEVLLFQRKKGDMGGGLFEFPGGKVEVGESLKQALLRELQEELGIHVQIHDQLGSAEFQGSSGREFLLTVFFVTGPLDEIQLLEHDSMKWVSREAVVEAELALGDRPLMGPCYDYLDRFYSAKK